MKRTIALVLLSLLLPANPCEAEAAFVIGSKKFTESYILGAIARRLVEQAGLHATHREGLGGTIILWQALLSGDIAAYPEYTGTITAEILKAPAIEDENSIRAALQQRGIGMTSGLGFQNNYTLVMKRERAAGLGVRSIGDLKRHPSLRAGISPEFLGRQDGWKPLVSRYGLAFAEVRGIEHGLGYAALANDLIDIKDCYTTDAKIAQLNLVALEDDLQFFPAYEAVFLYRLDAPPAAVAALKSIEGRIGTTRMIALNRMAEEAKDYDVAAAAFIDGKETGASIVSEKNGILRSLIRLTAQHLTLVFISLSAAIFVSIPLGVVARAPGIAASLILGAAGIIQTIPSLALLALMIPVFGIGETPAIVALFLYSLLPIVRSTATGLMTIPATMREAAIALGLETRTRLWLIDLPLASPSILSGIKTSAVINVGTATLAGLIGGGGYGEPIQSGLQLNDTPTILLGAIPAAILALLVQAGFQGLDGVLIPRGLRIKGQAG